MKILSYLSEVEQNGKHGWSERPIALVFTKVDQAEVCRDACEHGPGDDADLDAGHPAFRHPREAPEDLLGDDESEHGIAEKLEPLVVGVRIAVLYRRRMRERPDDQVDVRELVPGRLLGYRDALGDAEGWSSNLCLGGSCHVGYARARIKVALCPPKPNELLRQILRSAWRATFGT